MTRKRNRTRSKSKQAAQADLAVDTEQGKVIVDGGDESEQLSPDSGTASPAAMMPVSGDDSPHFCSESIKAWKFYQACMLERYHWYLDKRRSSVTTEFSSRISETCLLLTGDNLVRKLEELQTSMSEQLSQLKAKENVANARFQTNLKSLEAGVSVSNLEPVDPNISLAQVEEFINKYTNATEVTASTRQKDLSYSFSGSTSSEDSGVVLPESKMETGFTADIDVTENLGLSALSDIWKPDRTDFLDASFSTGGLYTGRSVESEPAFDANLFPLPAADSLGFHVPPLPTVADDDSAILQAVVSTQEPEANPVNDVLMSNLGNALLSVAPFTSSSTEYGCFGNPVCDEFSTLATNLGSLPTFSSTDLNQQEEAVSTNVTSIGDVREAPANPEGTCHVGVGQPPDQVVNETGTTKKKKKKKKKAKVASSSSDGETTEPVKFTDRKKLDASDKVLVDQLSFGWKEGVNNGEVVVEGNVASSSSEQPAKPPPKVLSFAAVVSTPSTQATPVQKTSERESSNETMAFSTKKPGRKYSNSSSLNKTSICWTFMNKKACPWGDDCIFAHGKKELQPLPKWFKKEEMASKAPSKKDTPPHSEPCGNHYCYWRIQYLRRKTAICKLWQSGRCSSTKANCPYAHGQSDVKPLPKLEMCRMFKNGKCTLKPTECVYAHSKAELRLSDKKAISKGVKKATLSQEGLMSCSPSSRLRTISETSVGSNDSFSSWSSVYRQERVRTVSGTSLYSNDSLAMRDLEEFDWKAWDSQQEVPTDEELNDDWNLDECVICSFDFSEVDPKFSLECEHDNFHLKCISQWIINKDKSCPICRHPANMEEARFKQLKHIDDDDEARIMVDE